MDGVKTKISKLLGEDTDKLTKIMTIICDYNKKKKSNSILIERSTIIKTNICKKCNKPKSEIDIDNIIEIMKIICKKDKECKNNIINVLCNKDGNCISRINKILNPTKLK